MIDEELFKPTEPDCPNCGTRCVVIRGHYVCRTCKVSVLEITGGP